MLKMDDRIGPVDGYATRKVIYMQDSVRDAIEAAESDLEFPLVEAETERDLVTEDLMKKFGLTIETIKATGEKYMPLVIRGVEDKAGYNAVHTARMEVRDMRLEVDRRRKAAKAEALDYTRKCDKVGNLLFDLIEPIETHLNTEEKRIDAEVERLKAAKQKEIDDRLQARVSALTAVGAPFQLSELVQMSDMVFDMVLKTATETWEAKEKLRKEQEAAALAYEAQKAKEAAEAAEEKKRKDKEEAEAMAEEKKKLALQKAEQDKKAAELKAKEDAIERKEREEKIRQDEAAKAKAKADQDAKDAAAEEDRKAKAQAARLAAIEAAAPDADKLDAFEKALLAVGLPIMTTDEGKAACFEVADARTRLCNFIHKKAAALTEMNIK